MILKNCIETSFYERLDECCSEFRGLLASKDRELFSKYDVTCEVPSILDCMTYVTKDMRIFRDLNGIAKPWWIKNDEDRENYINEQGYFNKTNMLKSNIGFRPMLTIRTKSAIDRRDFKMNNIFNDINTKADLLKFVDDSEIKIIYKDKIIVPIYDSIGNIESYIEYRSKSEADKTKDESNFYDSNEELNDINTNGVKNRRIERGTIINFINVGIYAVVQKIVGIDAIARIPIDRYPYNSVEIHIDINTLDIVCYAINELTVSHNKKELCDPKLELIRNINNSKTFTIINF